MAAIETQRQQYYDHSAHIATYYALYISLEQWLAASLFKGDISRVFLASGEYAYRRRFELTDPSVAYDSVSSSSLQFPFANYWPLNSGWRPDTRVAAANASLIENGFYTRQHKLRAMPVTLATALMLHFDREDDARVAYERLLWMSYRERYYSTSIAWEGEVLGIPMNIKVENLSFNPKYREQDWLESNRVFVVETTLQLRSYIVTPTFTDSSFDTPSSSPFYYLTEEAKLQLFSGKNINSEIVVRQILDFNPTIAINQLAASEVTSTTATVVWNVTSDPLQSVEIRLGGTTYTVDPSLMSYKIVGLTAGSEYTATVTFITTTGVSKSLALSFATEGVQSVGLADSAGLVGTNW